MKSGFYLIGLAPLLFAGYASEPVHHDDHGSEA